MTTNNLDGIEKSIIANAEHTAQWRQRAANLLAERERLDADKAKARADAMMMLRGIEQSFTDKAGPLDEEIGQVVNIVSGPAVVEPEHVAPVEPEPEAPAPEPEPAESAPVDDLEGSTADDDLRAWDFPDRGTDPVPPVSDSSPKDDDDPETTASQPRVVAPGAISNLAITQWAKGIGMMGWILALVGAFVAFAVSESNMVLRVADEDYQNVQKFIWVTGWTFTGVFIGGSLGSFFPQLNDAVRRSISSEWK